MEPDDVANFTRAEENHTFLREWLVDIERNVPDSIDRQFATAVLKATSRAYVHLRTARLKDATYAAWACRNLLELHVIARWGVHSEENRKEFAHDLLMIDFEERAKIFAELASPEDAQDCQDHLDEIARRKADLEVVGTRYFDVRAAAGDVELADEYRQQNKLISKWVHPTPLAVMSEEHGSIAPRLDQKTLFHKGSNYVAEIVNDISALAIRLWDCPVR